MQVKRAKALGLDYKTYAGVRWRHRARSGSPFFIPRMRLGVSRRAAGRRGPSGRGSRMSPRQRIWDARLAPDVIGRRQIGAGVGADAAPFGASWSAMRDEMKAWLRAQGLPETQC